MKNLSLFASALAVLGLTACEKALVDDASGTILYRILSQTAADGADNFAATARIRPVATVSITKD